MNKPTTKKEWAAYRAQLQCKIGIRMFTDGLEPPEETTQSEYALFLLLQAVHDLALLAFDPTDITTNPNEL